jgi:integrase/recombinase XerC
MGTRDRIPLKDLMAQFSNSNDAANLSPRTVRWYDELLEAFLRWLEEGGVEFVLGSFTLERAEEYVRHLKRRNNQHNGRKLSPHTVHAQVRVLKVFSGYLADRGYTHGNVLRGLRYPRVSPPQIKTLSEKEILDILAAAATDRATGFRNYCIVATFLDNGLRCSELANLLFEDARLEEGRLEVTGKGNKRRSVPISPRVRGLLMRYSGRDREQTVPYHEEPFFLSEAGEPLTRNAVSLMLRRLGRRAGMPRLHPHLLRHTFATSWLRNGGDVETLRCILGHADYRMVQRYLHLREEDILARHHSCSPMERLLRQPPRGSSPVSRGSPQGSPGRAASTHSGSASGPYPSASPAPRWSGRRAPTPGLQPTARRRIRRGRGRSRG